MKIAIIDDARFIREKVKDQILKVKKCDITLYETGFKFIKDNKDFDLVFLDAALLRGISAKKVYEFIKDRNTNEVIVIHNGHSIDSAMDWINLGVREFTTKPPTDERIKELIEKYS